MAIIYKDTTGSLEGKTSGGDQTLVGVDPTDAIYGDGGRDFLDRPGDDVVAHSLIALRPQDCILG